MEVEGQTVRPTDLLKYRHALRGEVGLPTFVLRLGDQEAGVDRTSRPVRRESPAFERLVGSEEEKDAGTGPEKEAASLFLVHQTHAEHFGIEPSRPDRVGEIEDRLEDSQKGRRSVGH